MCTIWEMAETIRAEERQAAAAQAQPDNTDAREKPARLGSRMKARWLALTALFAGHRQFPQH